MRWWGWGAISMLRESGGWYICARFLFFGLLDWEDMDWSRDVDAMLHLGSSRR